MLGCLDPPRSTPSSKKRKAPSKQRRGTTKVSKGTPTAGSDETVTKPGLKSLALILAAKNGVSVLNSMAIKQESLWNYFHENYKLNLGGFVLVTSKRVFPYNSFIVRHLKGLDGARKV